MRCRLTRVRNILEGKAKLPAAIAATIRKAIREQVGHLKKWSAELALIRKASSATFGPWAWTFPVLLRGSELICSDAVPVRS